MERGPSTATADVVLGDQWPERTWVQPIADERVIAVDGDPADVATARESIRLAFVAALQHLPGPQDLADWFLGQGIGCQGDRLLPVDVNGTAGCGNYRLTRPGLWEPFALQVIEVAGGRIVGHHNFLYPERFPEFGLPPRLER